MKKVLLVMLLFICLIGMNAQASECVISSNFDSSYSVELPTGECINLSYNLAIGEISTRTPSNYTITYHYNPWNTPECDYIVIVTVYDNWGGSSSTTFCSTGNIISHHED